MKKKILVFITTAILACISIASLTAAIVTWDSWTNSQTSKAVAQKTNSCPGASTKTCLDIDVYEALNLMPRENRPLLNPRLEAQYGGTSSPPNPLVMKSGESVNFLLVLNTSYLHPIKKMVQSMFLMLVLVPHGQFYILAQQFLRIIR